MPALSRSDTSTLGRWWWTVDRWTLLAVATLIGFGYVMMLAASPAVAAIAEPGRVKALFREAGQRRNAFAAWTLLFYALWHRAHIQGLPPAGDAFEALSAR